MEGSKNIESAEVRDIEQVSISVRRPRTRRFKLAQRLNPRKTKMLNCSCLRSDPKSCIPLSTRSEQELISSIPCHVIFIFLNPILIGVLQVKYQSKHKSPFETYPVHMGTFLVAICLYSTILGTKIYIQTTGSTGFYHAAQIILSHLLLLSGAISSASLVFIFLPRPLVFLLISILVSVQVIMARGLLKILLWWVLAGVGNLISKVRDNLNMLAGSINQSVAAIFA